MVVWGLNLPPHQGCSPISARDWIILLRKAWARYWLKAPSIFPHKLQLMPHVFFSPTGGITFLHKKMMNRDLIENTIGSYWGTISFEKNRLMTQRSKKKTWCVAEICQVSGRLPEAIASADQGCNLLDCWCLSSGSFKLTSPIIECGQGISSL